MAQEKYLNPFTDFGFKKLFGSEPNKDLLIDVLNQLLPPQHQIQELTYARNELLGDTTLDRGAVFDSKLLDAAEIGKFNREEMAEYENSLKHYRDMRNVIDTAELKGEIKGRAEGLVEGRAEGLVEGKAEVARAMLAKGFPVSVIAELTGLTEEEIAALSKPQTEA